MGVVPSGLIMGVVPSVGSRLASVHTKDVLLAISKYHLAQSWAVSAQSVRPQTLEHQEYRNKILLIH